MRIGVIHGRFQPFHKGHLYDYALKAFEKCDHLIVGIANADERNRISNSNSPHRHKPESNPLTYYERQLIIRDCLLTEGLTAEQFTIVPFPISFPNLIKSYTPEDSIHYLTIFDKWGNSKVEKLKNENLNVVVLFEKKESEKLISSSLIRHNILNNLPYDSLIHPCVNKYIEEFSLKARLTELIKYE